MIDVVYTKGDSIGWSSVTYFSEMLSRLAGGELTTLPHTVTNFDRVFGLRGRRAGRSDTLIAILHNPFDIDKLRASITFRKRYKAVAIWIIDSFNLQWVPRAASLRDIDLIIVMRPNDVDAYERVAPGRVLLSAWGSDVLRLGSGSHDRPIDVLRLGRQPDQWNDDDVTEKVCKEYGLTFSGRLPLAASPTENHRLVVHAVTQTRFVIAHSNVAAPALYTHPSEEYITSRWVDSIAAGACVAGVQPRSDKTMERLLWPGAVLDFDRIDLRHNLAALSDARASWRPEDARLNYSNSLARLDWRWRIAEVLERLGETLPSALLAELSEIEAKLAGLQRLPSEVLP